MTDDKALEHAWRYFSLHASQRMTVFNYFVVFAGVLCTGMAAALQSTAQIAIVGVALGGLLALLSFVFHKLDQRTSFLIKHAEQAIRRSNLQRRRSWPARTRLPRPQSATRGCGRTESPSARYLARWRWRERRVPRCRSSRCPTPCASRLRPASRLRTTRALPDVRNDCFAATASTHV